MSKMSELHLAITELLEQGDNVYRIAEVLEVPVEMVLEIDESMIVEDYKVTEEDCDYHDTVKFVGNIVNRTLY